MIQLTDSIKNSKKFQTVKTIVNELKSNGHAAFIVGGAVRDLYLKKSPKNLILQPLQHQMKSKVFLNTQNP